MASIDASAAPRIVKPRAARDEIGQRCLILVVIAYLTVCLVLPLGMVLMKSLQQYSFAPAEVTVAFAEGAGYSEPRSLQSWYEESGKEVNDGLRASERTRIPLVQIIPKPARRGVESFRVTDHSAAGGMLLLGGTLSAAGQSYELTRREFSAAQLKPELSYGLSNFRHYFSSPALFRSVFNSFKISLAVVLIVVPLAFGFAYALTRAMIPFKGAFRLIATVPVLAPSLLPAIGLIYLFGNQGVLTPLLMGGSIYGPTGIIMASVFYSFPHALIIMVIALSAADQRLYEAADALGANRRRTFFTVTLPGARYGVVSAVFVVFTLVMTDFGVPKVVGGDYNVLALDIYKQVIGQQNFQIGAVVSMVLLLPAVLAFAVDRYISKRQVSVMSAKAAPYVIKADPVTDRAMLALCLLVSAFILGVLAMCQFAALAKFWPYDLTPGLRHYEFDRMDGGGWSSYFNSLRLAFFSATFGAAIIFIGSYLVEKTRGFLAGRTVLQFLAMMPMAIPGMVLGLAYIFFFNSAWNPLNILYGTMLILVLNTIVHLYTVSHLTAASALKQMDREFEAVSMSLKQPFWRMLGRVSAPVCLPAISEIWLYIFVNAMTTVSAVVFLYGPQTNLASIAVLNMDDAGDIAPAAAMGMMIFYTNGAVRIVYGLISERFFGRLQAWRRKDAA